MTDTQVNLTSPPYSNAEDCKKHIMKIYENLTKDCKDELLRRMFDQVVDYDTLNACAIRMFSCVADKGLLDEAKELFKPHPEQTTLPEVSVFTMVMVVLMMAISSTETIKAAHKVFQQMIASGVTPTTYTYTLLIDAFTKDLSDSNFVGYAKKYFLEMLDRGMKPQDQLYLKVVGTVTYQEPAEEVKKFLGQLKAKGFIPAFNFFKYNEDHGATEALQACKTYMNVSTKITDKAVQKFFCQSVKSGWFMQAIEMQMALVDDGNVDEAIEFSHTIQQTEFVPLVGVYTSLIEAYLKFGKTKGALDAYLEMLAAGVAPNSYTYTVLIKGLSADPEFFGDARKYLLEMMDNGKQPNAATYTAVIEGFARREDEAAENEGKEFVEVMMGKGFVPNAKAMREALKGSPIPVIRRIMNIVLSKLKD